jgi:hypothetical protein
MGGAEERAKAQGGAPCAGVSLGVGAARCATHALGESSRGSGNCFGVTLGNTQLSH